jgi:hypothetical protein
MSDPQLDPTDLRSLDDDLLNALALDGVRTLVQFTDLLLTLFGPQLANLHLDDDLRLSQKLLRRVSQTDPGRPYHIGVS